MQNDIMNGFLDGWFDFDVRDVTPSELASSLEGEWSGGFAAASRGEVFLDSIVRCHDLCGLLGHGAENSKEFGSLMRAPLEGPIMEAGLWRQSGKNLEEVSIERGQKGFLLQHWRFWEEQQEGRFMCHYRDVELPLYPRLKYKGAIFARDLVVPELRMHVFMTMSMQTGRKTNER